MQKFVSGSDAVSAKNALQSVRGMNDLLPSQTAQWQHLEARLRAVAARYGYREIRTPIIERSELFYRSIGEQTDIVEKEMYTFTDNNGDSLTLRPEATASTVRAGNQHGLLYNQTQRLWYTGPMFRHERPQKGRYRQFHQFGIEALGWSGPEIEAEVICLGERLWAMLGLDGLRLEINTLGSDESRASFREALRNYLSRFKSDLDADSQRRLDRNPLRILDSKDPATREILKGAPDLHDFLQKAEREHFERLQALLSAAGIAFHVNTQLVRGLDYYTGFVFEWITDQLGAQSAVCAGGRYDGLVAQLGGRPTPAAGFACGLERLIELVSLAGERAPSSQPDVFVISEITDLDPESVKISETLRDHGMDVVFAFAQGSLKKQMKRADLSGAGLAVIVDRDSVAHGSVLLKPMRDRGEKVRVPTTEIGEAVKRHLKRAHE